LLGLKHNLPFGGRSGSTNQIAARTAAQTRYRQFLADTFAATAASTSITTTTIADTSNSGTGSGGGGGVIAGSGLFGVAGGGGGGASANGLQLLLTLSQAHSSCSSTTRTHQLQQRTTIQSDNPRGRDRLTHRQSIGGQHTRQAGAARGDDGGTA
jgi:hypothetical protein